MSKKDTHICSDVEEYLKDLYGQDFEFTKFAIRKYKDGIAVVTITCKAKED